MKYLILAAMLLTTNAFAQTASKIPSLTVAGRTFTDLSNLVVLYCNARLVSGYNSCKADEDSDGTWTNYEPSGTNKLRIHAIRCNVNGNAGVEWLMGTAPVGPNSGAPPAGRINYGAIEDAAFNIFHSGSASVEMHDKEVAIDWVVPDTYYPHIFASQPNIQCWMYGYEEA